MEKLNRPAGNPLCSRFLALLINFLRSPNPFPACVAWLQSDAGVLEKQIWEPATDSCPSWFAGKHAGGTTVAIDGTTRIRQLEALVDSYTGVLQSGFNDPNNSYLDAAATAICNRLRNEGMVTGSPLYLAGWSLGGAIATLVPRRSLALDFGCTDVQVVSFGAPRPSGETIRQRINSNCRLTRWMNTGDPIPLCPPRSADFPPIAAIIGIRPALRWGNFCHPRGGVELKADGSMVEAAIPSGGAVRMITSLANWMFSVENDPANEHHIDLYGVRLQAIANRQSGHARVPEAPAEVPENVPHREMNRAEREAQATVLALQAQQNRGDVHIPSTSACRHERLGKLHVVTFRGQVIATTTRKQKAIGIKNDMNKFLERLQTAAVVDPAALSEQLTGYLADAVDGGGEFRPPMNTSWQLR